jgi:predicted deacylase
MALRSRVTTLRIALLVAATTVACGGREAPPMLVTTAEQSGFTRTGRYDEVERLCAAFQQAWPANVRCVEFGRSPENRPMLALVASADGTLDAASARQKNRPVVVMQGGIHAGEIDGKDAGFLALKELLDGKPANVLARVTFVFVPVFNVDGHERFGRWNRPNQVGPEEMGWRTTAQNLNLNRDYTKADAPEMQAMLRLLGEWDPILYADLHVTDGAQFEHDVSFSVTPTLAGDEELIRAGVGVRDELLHRLAARGSLPIDFYPDFIHGDDPTSGFAVAVSQTRFSQQYWAARNRLAVLVETHSWKDYATRVRITHDSIIVMLELAAARGADWRSAATAADQRSTQIGGSSVALAYENTDHVSMIDFRGYAYTREPSAISGGLATRYDNTRPQVWRIPLKDQVRPSITVIAPRGGYLVPPAHARWVGEKLALHGIQGRTVTNAATGAAVQTFRATKAAMAPETFEGRAVMSVEGEWTNERRDIPAGSLFVPIGQARSHLLMTLLEPRDPDSFVSWGFFNAAFERKEYMEAYVAEDVGAKMLREDAELKHQFERRLRDDRAFAGSPAARLDFFYQRHPSWDDRFNLYPIYRIDGEP